MKKGKAKDKSGVAENVPYINMFMFHFKNYFQQYLKQKL